MTEHANGKGRGTYDATFKALENDERLLARDGHNLTPAEIERRRKAIRDARARIFERSERELR